MKDKAIVLTAFGTSTSARNTYTYFEKSLQKRYPDHDIFWSFSSKLLRKKMKKKDITWHSPEQILKNLKKNGYKGAVVQSLHIVPGIEFEKTMHAVQGSPVPATVGKPLLSSEIDCHRALKALSAHIPDPAEWITLLVGHGTHHSGAGAMYMLFDQCIAKRYPENVFLCMVEGIPSWDATRKKLKKSKGCKIKFIPLMFVAGEHMKHDVLGKHKDSWMMQLEGYQIDSSSEGVGFNDKILDIYFDHLDEALSKDTTL